MQELTTREQQLQIQRRVQIQEFEAALAQAPGAFFGDTDNCPLTHRFADGQYVREIFIPKGMVLVGKIHRFSHANFLMRGKVIVVTEEGGRELIEAPRVMVSPAGTKRALVTLEDTVWVTVHNTQQQDLEEIEKEVIVESYELLLNEQQRALLSKGTN
ncbi:MAG: hypothetical protein LLF76_02715 [Planctomycetaceae bacterium]|nr:hypothetical protein [Planctomycetaceae bacterium]